jgi:ABC-type oligopeptide transport system substrate-binding subunit
VKRRRSILGVTGAVVILALVIAGCSEAGATAVHTAGSSPAASSSQETTQPSNAAEPTVEPSAATGGTKTYAVGQPIDVTGDFISSDVRVTVAQVKQAKSYGSYSKPAKGNVYLAVKYAYQGLEDGATYNPLDWQVFVDGTAVNNFTFVMDGPQPELQSGTLPKDRKAEGWVVYEVPTKGEVILSYGSNMLGGDAPTFEVVARKA